MARESWEGRRWGAVSERVAREVASDQRLSIVRTRLWGISLQAEEAARPWGERVGGRGEGRWVKGRREERRRKGRQEGEEMRGQAMQGLGSGC